jgi:glycosyltransferase involved in cell wall biosynthesis
MHVVYVHQHFSTVRGATGTRSYDFARMLVERGHRVTVVTGVYGPSEFGGRRFDRLVTRRRVDGIDVRFVNVRYDNTQPFGRRIRAFLAFMALSAREVLRIRDADVVFATSTPLTVGFPGAAAWYLRRVPFVFEVRDIWPESAVQVEALTQPAVIWVASAAERLFYRAAKRIVAISPRMAERLRTRIGPDGRKIRVIPLGTDYGLFDRASVDHRWRKRHGLENAFVAVYTGSHGRVNALDSVLDAAARLRDAPHIRVVLIGDGALKPHLCERARLEGLDNVLFLDPVPKRDLAGILKACDLGLMTLENYPVFDTALPNKFMDYLAAGLPVLVNFDGEAGWLCEREGCGVVVAPEDPRAMADAIRSLAGEGPLCREMGHRGRHIARDRFDRRRLAERFEDVLRQAADRR